MNRTYKIKPLTDDQRREYARDEFARARNAAMELRKIKRDVEGGMPILDAMALRCSEWMGGWAACLICEAVIGEWSSSGCLHYTAEEMGHMQPEERARAIDRAIESAERQAQELGAELAA